MKSCRLALLVWTLNLAFNSGAQHIHIQTSYTTSAGWDVFWYDFDSGAFPAADYTPVVVAAARGRISHDSVLINALGAVGNPVWTLPQVQTPELPAFGIGTQGNGSFAGGQIQLRLATFSGPGNFAIYTSGPFGEANLVLATRDGLNASDTIILSMPGGHLHVNWVFTRPGLYRLGWRAEGILAAGLQTNSAVVSFQFRVADPAPPRLSLTLAGAFQRLTVETEGNLPLQLEATTNLTHWTALTNFWLQPIGWTWTNTATGPNRFYRAVNNFP